MSKEMKKCLRCGQCCRETIIEDVFELDLWREPRLAEHCIELRDLPGQFFLKTPCPFLGYDEQRKYPFCEIYPTRPNICVAHAPGTHHCCPQYDPDDKEYLDEFTD